MLTFMKYFLFLYSFDMGKYRGHPALKTIGHLGLFDHMEIVTGKDDISVQTFVL